METKTIGSWLNELANGDTCTEEDERMMKATLNRIGVNASVTCGLVYLRPPCQPLSIQQMAKELLKRMG